MKNLLLSFVLLFTANLQAQVNDKAIVETRRKTTHKEVKALAHMADSFLNELKLLYKLEQKENSPQKYQPNRIAWVRSYLLIFNHIENSASIVAYGKADIAQIFGKPGSTYKSITKNNVKQEEWLFGGLEKKYIRINNLRYRFYFQNGFLEKVKRDDK
jgi:hypothetical protein